MNDFRPVTHRAIPPAWNRLPPLPARQSAPAASHLGWQEYLLLVAIAAVTLGTIAAVALLVQR